MEFQPIYDTVTVGCALPVATTQTVADVRFPLPEGAAVLSVSARAFIKRCEKGADLRYEGELVATALCVGSDGAFSVTQTVLFADTVTASCKGECYACAQIAGVEVVSVTEREARAAFTVNVAVFSQERQEISGISAGSGGLYTKQANTAYMCCKAAGEKVVEVTEEVENPFDTVCKYAVRAVVTKRSAGPEVVTIEGEIFADVIGKKENEWVSKTFTVPFVEELAIDGARYGDTVSTDLVVTNATVTAQESILTVGCEMNLRYEVCTDGEFSYVTDVYCVENELNVSENTVRVCTNKTCETVYDRVDGTITIEDAPLCESILCADGFRGEVASASCEDGSLCLQCVVCGNVLYTTSDGSPYALPVSIPFSLSFLIPCAQESEVNAQICPTAVSVRARRGNEIDVKVELAVSLTVCKTQTVRLLCDVSKGEARARQTAALSVYVGQSGDTLWEVARELGCAPDDITAQNETVFPLEGGERIVLYRCLKV